ncbi:MAG: hypothetical protein IH591_04825 [Bacteroidales bacterium]|nr:hypothetical protein [Bacteroidales bacterium]
MIPINTYFGTGVRCQVSGIGYQVSGIRYQVSGIGYTPFGSELARLSPVSVQVAGCWMSGAGCHKINLLL